MEQFLSQFGGIESFERLVKDKAEYHRYRKILKQIHRVPRLEPADYPIDPWWLFASFAESAGGSCRATTPSELPLVKKDCVSLHGGVHDKIEV